MTGSETVDKILAVIGGLYAFLTIVVNVLPKNWAITVVLAHVVADLKKIVATDAVKKAAPLLVLAFFGFVVSACAGSLEMSKKAGTTARLSAAPGVMAVSSPERCESLDDQSRTWGAIAKSAAVLSGAGGISSIPISSDQKELRTGVVITSVALAGLAALAVGIEEGATNTWARDCSSSPK